MNGIKINADGTPVIINGDFITISHSRLLSQKIYRAIMNMPPDMLSGKNQTKTSILEPILISYLSNFFNGDPDIDGSKFQVEIENSIDQKVDFTVKYNENSSEGNGTAISTGLDFLLEGGALLTVNYSPEWLSIRNKEYRKQKSYYIKLEEDSQEILVPVEPYTLDTDSGISYPIVLTLSKWEDITDIRKIEFSIPITDTTMLYPISRYIPGFTDQQDVILNYQLDDTDLIYNTNDMYGEYVIIVKDQTGTLTGYVNIMTAVQFTYSYIIKNTIVNDSVFKLKPVQGHYYVQFPKTVSKGEYVIQYTGKMEIK